MSRFWFVADHRDTFEVKRLCEVIEVNRSSFYAWDAAAPVRAERSAADEDLARRIRAVHEADRAYGAPRVTAELNDGAPAQERVNHKRVVRDGSTERPTSWLPTRLVDGLDGPKKHGVTGQPQDHSQRRTGARTGRTMASSPERRGDAAYDQQLRAAGPG